MLIKPKTMKWNIVVSTSQSHFPGFRALYNSFKERYDFNEIEMHLLSFDIDEPTLDKLRKNITVVQLDKTKHRDKIWACKIERFKYASELDGVVMLLDSDMFFCGDMRPYLYLAEQGYIIGGSNGSNFRFHQGWRDKYQIPEIPDFFDYKTICSVPTIMDVKRHGDVWKRLYDHKLTIGTGADFDLTNVFMVVCDKFKYLIALPSQQTTGIHHFMLKPDTCAMQVDGKLVTRDGLEILMVHGKWWSEGWFENLMKPMQKYCRGDKKYEKMAEISRDILKQEFDKYTNMDL